MSPLPMLRRAVILSALALALPALADNSNGYQAVTKPSKDITLSFVRPGRVDKVLVGKGDQVKAGELVAKLDDSEELAALAIDKLMSEDTTEIEAEESVLKQDIIDNDRIQKTPSAQSEKDRAALEIMIAQARIKIAQNKLEQAKLKYQQSLIAVEKLKVTAPISGVIAEEFLKAGESAEGGNMKVMRVVQLDPLWVEVPVPITQARQIKKSDPARVTFDDGKMLSGKVDVVSPVGDSASETLLIRVEVSNPEKIPSGENVFVSFGPPAAVAKP
jgi:RND family efflux transporter MFP subunit